MDQCRSHGPATSPTDTPRMQQRSSATSDDASFLLRQTPAAPQQAKSLPSILACLSLPLSSGGVLLDSNGNVLGINTAIADPTGKGSSSGVGFAIPIDTVKGLVDQILQYGRVMRPSLGIVIAPPQALQRVGEQGVLVLDVTPNSPAARAGLRPTSRNVSGDLVLGDIIKGLDGQPVSGVADLLQALDSKRVGDQVVVDVARGSKRLQFTVTLADRVLGAGTE